MVVILTSEAEMHTFLSSHKIKFSNVYFLKTGTLVVETPFGISRDEIKQIEQATTKRFTKIDVRESPMLGYQTIVEVVFDK